MVEGVGRAPEDTFEMCQVTESAGSGLELAQRPGYVARHAWKYVAVCDKMREGVSERYPFGSERRRDLR